jgi:hypothetical protein
MAAQPLDSQFVRTASDRLKARCVRQLHRGSKGILQLNDIGLDRTLIA